MRTLYRKGKLIKLDKMNCVMKMFLPFPLSGDTHYLLLKMFKMKTTNHNLTVGAICLHFKGYLRLEKFFSFESF